MFTLKMYTQLGNLRNKTYDQHSMTLLYIGLKIEKAILWHQAFVKRGNFNNYNVSLLWQMECVYLAENTTNRTDINFLESSHSGMKRGQVERDKEKRENALQVKTPVFLGSLYAVYEYKNRGNYGELLAINLFLKGYTPFLCTRV